MNAGGLQCNQHIACLLAGGIHDLLLVHNADCKTCKVVLVNRIETRHFSSFAAHQCAAGLYTAVSDTGYDGCDLFRIVLADCNVIEEELRLCAAADDVIDTHCHTIDTNSIMLVHQERKLELGADTVGTRYKYRLLNTGQVRLEQTTKAADAGQNTRNVGLCDMLLHELDCLIAGCDVYAGFLVAFRKTIHGFPPKCPKAGKSCASGLFINVKAVS